MKKLRIYVDTSVIGGCFDQEFVIWSTALVEDFRQRRDVPVASNVTAVEVAAAPEFVQTLYSELLSLSAEVIDVTDEAVSLVESYTAHSVLSPCFYNDMLHILLIF